MEVSPTTATMPQKGSLIKAPPLSFQQEERKHRWREERWRKDKGVDGGREAEDEVPKVAAA